MRCALPVFAKITCADPAQRSGHDNVDVLLLQIGQQIAAAANHLHQAAAAVVIMLVGLEVLGQVVDARGEQRDLDLRGTGVGSVGTVCSITAVLSSLRIMSVVHLS